MHFDTAAVAIISNEMLMGESNGGNSYNILIKQLNLLGLRIQKIAILPLILETLSREIKILIKNFDIVIIFENSKTEENILYESIAYIYNEKLIHAKEINENNDFTNKSKYLIPANSRVLKSEDGLHSIIHIGGLFVLKTEYNLLNNVFVNLLTPYLMWLNSTKRYERILYSTKNELINFNYNSFIDQQEDTKIKCENISKSDLKIIKISLSSSNFNDVLKCEEKIKSSLGEEICYTEVSSLLKTTIYQSKWFRVVNSLEIIEECYNKYKPDEIFLSFNGGKDCTVLLHLTVAVLIKLYPDYKKPILSMYVQSNSPFPELEMFIQQCKAYYSLDVITITADIKTSLNSVLIDRPYLKACLMGTRKTDPFSEELLPFQMTDANWPQIMRVSPLLDWHYSDIWDFLLSYGIPYCSLYDQGFTSLGNINNTRPNPDLQLKNDITGMNVYLPAYKLLDGSLERLGRIVNKI